MVDKVEATKNLQKLRSDRHHLQQLNHLNSRYAFKDACRKHIELLSDQIKSLEYQLRK